MLIKLAICNFLLKYVRSPAPHPRPCPQPQSLKPQGSVIRFKSSYSAASVFQAIILTMEVCLSF